MELNDTIHSEWAWESLCPTGIQPWIEGTNDLAPCFQLICLHSPVLILFAIISAYYFGTHAAPILRNNLQLYAILLRMFTVLVLAILPLLSIYKKIYVKVEIWPISVFVACIECITWIVHLGFLVSLRNRGSYSARGPLLICVLWSISFMLAVMWYRSNLDNEFWPFALGSLLSHIAYGLSLLPTGKAVPVRTNDFADFTERHGLLMSRYVQFQDEYVEYNLGNAQDGASCLSKLTFYWVNALISKGILGQLKRIDDLFDLPSCISVYHIVEKMQKCFIDRKTLFVALHKNFGCEFYLIGIYRLVADVTGFAGPLLLGALLDSSTTETTTNDNNRAYLYALGLFLSSILIAFCGTHFNWRISLITMKMRIAIITSIYNKIMTAKSIKDVESDVLNLMSTDTDRIVNSCISFHSLWSIPLQLFTSLYLLYIQLGISFLAGVFFAIALIPINRCVAKKIGSLSTNLMAAKDKRVSMSTETLRGIKQVKLLAWEDVFTEKLKVLRKKELKYLKCRKYLDAICVYFWATTPILMSLLTFGFFVMQGNTLTPSITFTSVALLNMLIGPLNAFPWVLNGVVEALVSLKRVQQLMNIKDLKLSSYYAPTPIIRKDSDKPTVLKIVKGDFSYHKSTLKREGVHDTVPIFVLQNINFEVKVDELVCITGGVGAGKTALLLAIIAELDQEQESLVYLRDINLGFGYVSQSPWLQRGSIRDNIIWGSVFDEEWYRKVCYACALNDDFETLGGDGIMIGENGRTLSGGQRARVALARAVYQNKSIYLLDNVLAAVDGNVANHIIDNCILDLLKFKTRIIVTEHKKLISRANQVLYVTDKTVRIVSGTAHQAEIARTSDNVSFLLEDTKHDPLINVTETTTDDEFMETGVIEWGVIRTYWKSMGCIVGLFVLLSVASMQMSRNFADVWLAKWVNSLNGSNTDDQNNMKSYYLEMYVTIVVVNSILTFIRAFLFAWAGIKAAKYIHNSLVKRVFRAQFDFFDITPLGRILNRFSSDTYTVDDSLPFILNILLAQTAGLIGAFVICLYAMPWLILLIVPILPVYLNLQHRYRNTSREVKRLNSIALSPIYIHFTESVQGLSTISAMRTTNKFKMDFVEKLEDSLRAQISSSAAQQWLGLRIQLLGATLVGGAGLIAAMTSAHVTNPGLVGLAISYALSITGLLSGTLNAIAETEQELIAVERIRQYLKVDVEANERGTTEPPFGWPSLGTVNYDNVFLKYRNNIANALNGINFNVDSCERIGICGRTGAGKSSILSALFRTVPLSSGAIHVDNVDLKLLPLNVIRKRFGLVPQDPFLFHGSIRDNLDPRHEYLDTVIWKAIGKCLATPLVQNLGGLDGQVDAEGSNLSAGQKQLLCLVRVMLKNSKIVCIDEGTANLDNDTENAIQLTLKDSFRSSTLIIIAHRLKGLEKCDRIIVLDKGKIIETGTPKQLKANKKSVFNQMLKEQNQNAKSNKKRNNLIEL